MKITVGQLRKLVREAAGEMGWDPRSDYEVNKWAELQEMLPGMEAELDAALQKIKSEVPKIRKPMARYTERDLANEVSEELGLTPGSTGAVIVYNVVSHLSRLQPAARYSHVPGGESFPRGRGGPGDTRGT